VKQENMQKIDFDLFFLWSRIWTLWQYFG
jgi:hypothetical protein